MPFQFNSWSLHKGGKKKKKKGGAGGKKNGGKAAAEKKDAKRSSDGKADKKNAKNGSSGDMAGVGDGGEVVEPKDSADFNRATPNGKESSIPIITHSHPTVTRLSKPPACYLHSTLSVFHASLTANVY